MSETPFATFADLKKRWPSCPAGSDSRADSLLEDASDMVRDRWPDVDARIAAGTLRARSVGRVVCQMVKRAMNSDDEAGVEEIQVSSGTLGETRKFANPDGALYFTGAEERFLSGKPAATGRAAAVDLSDGRRPDWL